jgi:ABC-type lipoprotein export system ATPase subunit/bifunctional DNA-binding transcriptional regulator/antitoxin component of YhaV-PrlF toxin-antitoxin module
MTLIECQNLVKIYTARAGVEVVALQGLDLSIEAGEMIGIVGESGSGKSTLLNVLGGLDQPSAGLVRVDGLDLLKLNETELDRYRCRKVGFVWQQTTRNLTPYLNARENVELPMRLGDLTPTERRARAEELLATVGLAGRAEHLPGQLSGGEQQRVAIAVALANRPAVLLADEPTGELDTATAQEIYAVLQKVNRETGTTLLVVSHDPGLGRQVGRVVAIRDGKTSTETVRVEPRPQPTAAEAEKPSVEVTQQEFEELLMLDSAGRVQIPREVLERLGIGGRVRLEVKGENILLQPVDGHRRAESTEQASSDDELLIAEDPLPEETQASKLIQRLRSLLNKRRGV